MIQPQFIAALQLQLSVLEYKNAMAGSDPHAATVGSGHLTELFVQWVTNNALDSTKANRVILQSETEYFSQWLAGQLIHAATWCMRGESTIDEAADPDHAYTALVIPDEDMFIAVHAHDDDAVITQLVDVEIVAPDARSQRGDERADFGGREHLVEARLLHVEDFSLERQDGLSAPVAALLGGTAGGIALHQEHFRERRIFLLAIGKFPGQPRAVARPLPARPFARLAPAPPALGAPPAS